ncbi:hypothetical protein NRB16_08155 [Pseudomonas sp. LJDD11]|uniref:hypothetical protein n=1 Tax=Pseudomonas sp. LJDD11 TaxID=2931984 RepID=UPI00211BBF2C|nr:hypothetical protein [Pseudomonas sp. LJDD11]MCQ9423493.1 hypothetical protein [Pseudomonas sp. LJDD11]
MDEQANLHALPDFLRAELSGHVGNIASLTPLQRVARYRASAEQLIANKRAGLQQEHVNHAQSVHFLSTVRYTKEDLELSNRLRSMPGIRATDLDSMAIEAARELARRQIEQARQRAQQEMEAAARKLAQQKAEQEALRATTVAILPASSIELTFGPQATADVTTAIATLKSSIDQAITVFSETLRPHAAHLQDPNVQNLLELSGAERN